VTVDYRAFYRGRSVTIAGGLGFIGNLASQLVELGAGVLLVDSLIPDYGGKAAGEYYHSVDAGGSSEHV
jgi:hypothetical protein